MEKTLFMKAAAAAAGAAVVAGVVLAVSRLSQHADSYRSILVYEVEGSAQIDRESAGVMNAVENLYLESGDVLTVSTDSFMRLCLDDDKYVTAEEDSVFSVEATGTKEDSKTRINLIQGAIVNEIQNPLSAGSVYEVTTPNSIMAVRGTIFRVEISFDENGEVYTILSVYEGKVVSRLIFPDGTMDEEVSVEAGGEVIIHSNDRLTEYVQTAGGQETSREESGSQNSAAEETLENSPEGKNHEELPETAGQEAVEQSDTEQSDTKQDESEERMYAPRQTESPQALKDTTQAERPTVSETTAAMPETTEETSPLPSQDRGEDRGGGGGSSGGGRRPRPTEDSSETPAESTPESDPPTEGTSESESQPESTTQLSVYTVTFIYQGEMVGTQQVENGSRAARPRLNPAADGDWNFDFSAPVTEDTEILWN